MYYDSLVLANIFVCPIGIEEIETLEASFGHAFLILSPTNTLRIEQISNSGDVGWDFGQVVVIHSKVISSSNSDIVRLGRMCG